MSSGKKTLSQEIAGLAGAFLFNLPSGDSDGLDMRTRITSADQMKAMMYYGVLAKSLGSDKAGEIKDLMERLLISSDNGAGRAEAVETLRQNLPRKVEIDRGTDETID